MAAGAPLPVPDRPVRWRPNETGGFADARTQPNRPSGEIAALTPRSFQNGARFKFFRKRLNDAVDIDTLHIWRNRRTLFGTQDVLQETVCWHGRVRHETHSEPLVVITHADRERNTDWRWTTVASEKWKDGRLATDGDAADQALEKWGATLPTLKDLDLHVETGRHIGFRHRETLRTSAALGAIPYYSSQHVQPARLAWPAKGHTNWYDREADPQPLVNGAARQHPIPLQVGSPMLVRG